MDGTASYRVFSPAQAEEVTGRSRESLRRWAVRRQGRPDAVGWRPEDTGLDHWWYAADLLDPDRTSGVSPRTIVLPVGVVPAADPTPTSIPPESTVGRHEFERLTDRVEGLSTSLEFEAAAARTDLVEVRAERDRLAQQNSALRAQLDRSAAALRATQTSWQQTATERDSAFDQLAAAQAELAAVRANYLEAVRARDAIAATYAADLLPADSADIPAI